MPLGSKMAPPGGRIFYIGLYREKLRKIFLSETIRLRALTFGLYHSPVDLYQVCSNYAPGRYAQWSAFYQYVSFKQNTGERFMVTWSSCYMKIMPLNKSVYSSVSSKTYLPISGSWGVLVIIFGELGSKHILLETVCNQIRQVVGPDLDLNCLALMVFLKDF